MAPPGTKRMKGISIFRNFVYGTTARPFDPITNPMPPGTPDGHTHSWEVFVKGVDDTDITYWIKKVQFKLHESITNPLRTVENIAPGESFKVTETGWGEFEIMIKLYFVQESNEKAQTIYHHLRLHVYGETEKEKEEMRAAGVVKSWVYEEVVFQDPYESFFELLTTPMDRSKGAKGGTSKGTRVMKGGMVGSVGERTVTLPLTARPGQPFSRETEMEEVKRLKGAMTKISEETQKALAEKERLEAEIAAVRESMK